MGSVRWSVCDGLCATGRGPKWSLGIKLICSVGVDLRSRPEERRIMSPAWGAAHRRISEVVTTRSNQEQSEAIRSNQKPSEAIRSHQMPPETIRSHQRPSKAIKSHQKPSEAINRKSSESIRSHREPSEAIGSDLGYLSEVVRHLAIFAARPGEEDAKGASGDHAAHADVAAGEDLDVVTLGRSPVEAWQVTPGARDGASGDQGTCEVGSNRGFGSDRTERSSEVSTLSSRWQSMAINGNQWQSMAINGSQWQPMANHGKQWQSMAINGNQWHSLKSMNARDCATTRQSEGNHSNRMEAIRRQSKGNHSNRMEARTSGAKMPSAASSSWLVVITRRSAACASKKTACVAPS